MAMCSTPLTIWIVARSFAQALETCKSMQLVGGENGEPAHLVELRRRESLEKAQAHKAEQVSKQKTLRQVLPL